MRENALGWWVMSMLHSAKCAFPQTMLHPAICILQALNLPHTHNIYCLMLVCSHWKIRRESGERRTSNPQHLGTFMKISYISL